jgi:hypothetical protein
MSVPLAAQVAAPAGGTAPPPVSSAPSTAKPTISGPAGSGTVTVPPGGSAIDPFNSSGVMRPPRVPGTSFSRPPGTFNGRVIGQNPLGSTPANTFGIAPGQPVSPSGFPPPTGPVPPIVTNTGIGGFFGNVPSPIESSTFPVGAPPFIGNTVGQNFVAPGTNFPPRRALSVTLPPGARVIRNQQGVPEAVVPAPGIIPAPGSSAVGVPGVNQTGSQAGRIVPPVIPTAPIQPPPPVVRNPGARIPPVVRVPPK